MFKPMGDSSWFINCRIPTEQGHTKKIFGSPIKIFSDFAGGEKNMKLQKLKNKSKQKFIY